MTVAELIETLQDFDPDMEVKFSYNYGDYWNTIVARGIDNVDVDYVRYSNYHRMDKVITEPDEEDDDMEEVVLLS